MINRLFELLGIRILLKTFSLCIGKALRNNVLFNKLRLVCECFVIDSIFLSATQPFGLIKEHLLVKEILGFFFQRLSFILIVSLALSFVVLLSSILSQVREPPVRVRHLNSTFRGYSEGKVFCLFLVHQLQFGL